MGQLDHSLATLRIVGDHLNPAEITGRLGASPTQAFSKGEIDRVGADGISHRARTGVWRLAASRQTPEDLESQIFEILGRLSNDLGIWKDLAKQFKIDLFCGIFMGDTNDGLSLSSKAILALGERGIALEFDLYDAS